MMDKIDWKVLIFDKDHHHNYKASIGKTTFWITLIPALYFWMFMINITSAHLQVLLASMTYNLAKKLPILGGAVRPPDDPISDGISGSKYGERWKINVAYASKYDQEEDNSGEEG